MDVPLHLPVLRKQHLHRVFVLCRQDQHRLRGIDAKICKRAVKQSAHLLKLVGNPPRLFFPGIARNHKMRAAYLDPSLIRVARAENAGARKQRCNRREPRRTPP